MESKYNVIGIGTAVVDDLLILPEFPSQNTRIEALQRKKQLGGSVPMALKTLSAMGFSSAFIGKIGTDEDSGLIKKHLKESNINVSHLIEERGVKSPYAQVWLNINNGTRTTAIDSGNAPILRERNISFENLPDCNLVHIDGKEQEVTKKLIHFYKEKGSKISIDTGRFRPKTVELLNLADIIIMPHKFALEWQGKNNFIALISQIGAKFPNKLVVITDGPVGSVGSYQGEIIRQKAYKVNCVDSSGVGGVFSGGIICGMLNNWDIPYTLEFASAAAAIKCKKVGNDELPKIEEIKAFLTTQV